MIPKTPVGPPALKIAELALWVHGWQCPEKLDEPYGDWLVITAHCGGKGASVWVSGPIVMLSELLGWASQCEALYSGSVIQAALQPIEPGLQVTINPTDKLGHLVMRVEITADHLDQHHRFDFHIDQSYLPGIVAQCYAVRDRWREQADQCAPGDARKGAARA